MPFKEAILGDANLIKVVPAKSDNCQLLMLSEDHLVLHQTQIEDEAQKSKTLYVAKEGEYLIDVMTSDSGAHNP